MKDKNRREFRKFLFWLCLVIAVIYGVIHSAGSLPAKQKTPEVNIASFEWQFTEEKNKLDDGQDVIAALPALQIEGARPSRQDIALFVRCKQGKIEAYIQWDNFLGHDKTQVTYRIDEEKPITSWWQNSSNNQAAFSPAARNFIDNLIGKKQLVVQAVPYSENPVTATFHIAGLDKYIGQIASVCKWKR